MKNLIDCLTKIYLKKIFSPNKWVNEVKLSQTVIICSFAVRSRSFFFCIACITLSFDSFETYTVEYELVKKVF